MANNIDFAVAPQGSVRRDGWDCDRWHVRMSHDKKFARFDYFAGTGLRPAKPTAADVLYSLILDASARDSDFRDWCDEFGYSDDSIKAEKLYSACLENASKLDHVIPADLQKQISELLQDY